MEATVALDTLSAALTAGTVPSRDTVFATSLVTQAKAKGTLSGSQWKWVVTLAERVLAPAPEAATTVVADMSAVYAMFETAKAHLKYPKVVLHVEGCPVLKLYLSGNRSRVPNVVNVVDAECDAWYGRVYSDGKWDQGGDSADRLKLVAKALTEFAADPEGVAAKSGHMSGNCCFCNRSLKDDRSLSMGYGPTCAKKYNLKWGKK